MVSSILGGFVFPFSFNNLYVSNLASLLGLLLGGKVNLESENRPENTEGKFVSFPLRERI